MQCRNYYHLLLSSGKLTDPDYLDDKGRYSAKKVRNKKKTTRRYAGAITFRSLSALCF